MRRTIRPLHPLSDGAQVRFGVEDELLDVVE
jgi:hypothetical protein